MPSPSMLHIRALVPYICVYVLGVGVGGGVVLVKKRGTILLLTIVRVKSQKKGGQPLILSYR